MAKNILIIGATLLVATLSGCVSQPQKPASETTTTVAPTPAKASPEPVPERTAATSQPKQIEPVAVAAERPGAPMRQRVATTSPRQRSTTVTGSPDVIKPLPGAPTPTATRSEITPPSPTEPAPKPADRVSPRAIAKTEPGGERIPKSKPKPEAAEQPRPALERKPTPKPTLATTEQAKPRSRRPAARTVPTEPLQPTGVTTAKTAPVAPQTKPVNRAKTTTSAAAKATEANVPSTSERSIGPNDGRAERPMETLRDSVELGATQGPVDVTPAKPTVATADPGPEPQTQIAMITKESRDRPLEPDLSSLIYDEEHLPRTFAGDWVLDIRPDQLGNDRRCVLYSRKTDIFDGYESSWVRLQVTTDAVVVNSDSNLDVSYPDQGLRVDGGPLAPFVTDLLSDRSTFTRKPVQVAMAKGSRLSLSLGFWPTWPVTKTQTVALDLTGFKRAYAALEACTAAQ